MSPGGNGVMVRPGGVFFVGVASTTISGVGVEDGSGGTVVSVGAVLVDSPGSVPPDASVLVGVAASSVP